MKLKQAAKVAQFYGKRYWKPERAKQFANHMVPHVVRPAQIIWNKLLGVLFGALALFAFDLAYTRQTNPWAVRLGIFFGAVMLIFCIDAFLRVRRLNRLQRQHPAK